MVLAHSALLDTHTMTTPPTSRPPTSAGPRPTNDDIEAIIQMATSAHAGPAHLPPRDTRTQLFVGNLPYRVRWQDLKDLFRRAGTVLRADVSLAPDNRSRGYGTVLLATAEDAGRAVDMFNGFVWQTRTLEVRLDRMAAEDPALYAAGLSGGVGLGGGATTNAAATPFSQLKIPSIGPSPPLYPDDEKYLKTASPVAGLTSPTLLAAQLSGVHAPLNPHLSGNAMERSRSLFVGNLPFHIQWQDLKDLFRQAGTILRADVALGPDGRSRGFGTVSFGTEADAERAVRMFNGYEFNGRQLKVHFDKFSAASATAGLASANAGISISAPQSPHSGTAYASLRPAPLSHATSFAQQVLVHQHEQSRQSHAQSNLRADGIRSEVYQTAPFTMQRAATDTRTHTFRFQLPADEPNATNVGFSVASAVPKSLFDPPSALARAKSDSPQLFPHAGFNGDHQQLYQTSQQHTHSAPMHISLPPARPPYAFDFSPGSPYDVYHLTMASQYNGQAEGWKMEMAPQETHRASTSEQAVHDPRSSDERHTRPSTSPVPAPVPNALHLGRSELFMQHAHLRSESVPKTFSAPVTASASALSSQTQTQLPSPASTPPTPATQTTPPAGNSSSNTTHPAHPGPIALPPPPNVAGFPIPPPHTLSPAYLPQMSPYASPLHHPAVMMGMMGVNMTPHGLPPITPSMPSFTFLPQPSPNAPPTGHMGDLKPIPNAQGSMLPNGTGDSQQPHHPNGYIAHLHPHGPMLSPYTPFSPGVAMSPGAFWGRPGSAAVNPYMNAAVGAPVHEHQHSGYFPPVVAQRQPEEPQGYFPPFLPTTGSLSAPASKPSGLANEIQPDSNSTSGSAENGSVAEGAYARLSTGTSPGTTIGTNSPPVEPLSSNGTSWHTDSGDPSPDSALASEMGKLNVSAGKEDSTLPRANSADLHKGKDMPHALQRADSDPVQATSPTRLGANGTNGILQVGLGIDGQQLA